MNLSCGIVGLPRVGKTTLFNALTASRAATHAFGGGAQDPNIAVVGVPDPRLADLGRAFKSKKVTPATLQFVDVAGLAKGSSRGDGLGNQFLTHIREADAVIHVVRCFENDEVPHVEPTLDPARDAETVNLELALADLDLVEKRREKSIKLARSGDEAARKLVAALEKLIAVLGEGLPARVAELKPEEWALFQGTQLLTAKPVLYVANVDEAGLAPGDPRVAALEARAAAEGAPVLKICAQVEAELSALPPEERVEFMAAYGLAEPGLHALIRTAFSTLDLMTFLTAGEPESRAWTIRRGTKAPQAAGKIHSDLERGFIRMEVYQYDDWVACGRDEKKVKEKGLYRSEGKEYVMREGDVCLVRFNV